MNSAASALALVARVVHEVAKALAVGRRPLVVATKRVEVMHGLRDKPDLTASEAGTVRNLVCWAIVTPMEGAYGNQERHPGQFTGGP